MVVLCVVGFFVVVFLRCGGVFLWLCGASQETFILEASGVFCLCVFKLCFVCFLFVCFLSVLFVFSSLCFLSVCFSVCVCAMKGSRQLLSRSACCRAWLLEDHQQSLWHRDHVSEKCGPQAGEI